MSSIDTFDSAIGESRAYVAMNRLVHQILVDRMTQATIDQSGAPRICDSTSSTAMRRGSYATVTAQAAQWTIERAFSKGLEKTPWKP